MCWEGLCEGGGLLVPPSAVEVEAGDGDSRGRIGGWGRLGRRSGLGRDNGLMARALERRGWRGGYG